METPIAFVIFNRPDTTERVFEAVRAAQPAKLFVIADGPRAHKEGEAEKCAAARAIIGQVDWECDVQTNYSDVNLGCRRRVSSGLDWVFEQAEQAIILEDDCLPNPSFFSFCEEMLEKYRCDTRVAAISGTNMLAEWKRDLQSYHFSFHGSVWGWATWKRAWTLYDVQMSKWGNPEAQARFRDNLQIELQYDKLHAALDRVYRKELDSWAFPWLFATCVQSSAWIVPSGNLISNIGFGEEATHTKSSEGPFANLPTFPMPQPLKDPVCVAVDHGYDQTLFKLEYGLPPVKPTFVRRCARKLKSLLRSALTSARPLPQN